MKAELVGRVDKEIERQIEKWSDTDESPVVLIAAAAGELGEVAGAFFHNEGIGRMQQEICEVIGVLARLYDMVEA